MTNDFLFRLAARSLGSASSIHPMISPIFALEPMPDEEYFHSSEGHKGQESHAQEPPTIVALTSDQNSYNQVSAPKPIERQDRRELNSELPEPNPSTDIHEPETLVSNPLSERREDSYHRISSAIMARTNVGRGFDLSPKNDGTGVKFPVEAAIAERSHDSVLVKNVNNENSMELIPPESIEHLPHLASNRPEFTFEAQTVTRFIRNENSFSSESPSLEPVVRVNIGRVEVRAITAPTPQPALILKPPTLSLDEYLRKREGG